MKQTGATNFTALKATVCRELLSHRVNRFLFSHLALLVVTSVLAILIAPRDAGDGIAWFILNAVLYVISLSAVLLGLSSAQAERDEMPFLATQPMSATAWVSGKALGLMLIVAPSAFLLIVPSLVISGWSPFLPLLALATAGVCVVLTMLGLAVGLSIRDPIRGLVVAVTIWFFLLFATDLLLLIGAGSPWVQDHPAIWVAPLMLNPLDALRVTVLFTIEEAAFSTLGAGGLVTWWTQHAGQWLTCCYLLWIALALAAAVRGAVRARNF